MLGYGVGAAQDVCGKRCIVVVSHLKFPVATDTIRRGNPHAPTRVPKTENVKRG